MLSNFITVGEQVLILFILIAVGFVCGKINMFNDNSVKNMTDFVLLIVTPCVIIECFQRDFDPNMLKNLGISALISLCTFVCSIIIANLIIHDKNKASEKVYRFSAIFSNCAFMSLPLQSAILGADGVFYGAAFVAVFNLIVWSYGVISMSGDKNINFIKILLNPGILGVIIGITFFLLSIKLPSPILKPISYLAGLNTPLPMVIIGYHLSKAYPKKSLKNAKMYFVIFIRLILIPFSALGILLLFNIDKSVLIACLIAISAPTAAIATMFSAKYNQDTELSVNIVSISTLLSIITMPLIVALSQMTT